MALMTVGAGTLILGRGLIGPAAVGIDWGLWLAGTALGLVTAVWIPYLMMTKHGIAAGDAFGGWLMPVVPPMVSAATGALLIPRIGSAQGRLTMLLACYAMFGISLFASVIIITLVWSRLVTHKPGATVLVPTLWIVLGPLGQSVTAAGNLGFTFPVGTVVTATIALAGRSQADALRVASVVLYALLLVAWLVVAARTASGAASGRLFRPVAAISRALST
jgi:tellurite resistance protein TehA-like permease